MEKFLLTAPGTTWGEAAEKARYLITLLAGTRAGRDPRRQKLIEAVLNDFRRLSDGPIKQRMKARAEPLAGNHPMTDEKAVKPADDDISPYLQQPLRTLETARQDRKRRQSNAADAQARTKRRTDPWHEVRRRWCACPRRAA